MTANIAAASPRQPAASRCPPAGASGERCLPRCPRGPRRMGWPGQLGAVWVTWAAGGVQLPEGPRVKAFSIIRQSDLLLLLCGLLAPLALPLSRAHLPLPTKFLISRVPQRAGLRAVVGPCRPRIKGPLHARSPGPQVIFRPHVTNPLMQSSDAAAGCAAVWPLMGRSSSSFPPVRL